MKEFRKNEQGLFICEECGKLCENKCGLSHHIYKNHYPKQYFEKWLKDKSDVCKTCGNETEFLNFNDGYKKNCSQKCKSEKRKQTCFKKYNVEFSWQSKEFKEKSKQTRKEKYGDENYVNIKKCKETKKERYGDENYNNIEKYIKTCLKLYGVRNVIQSDEIFKRALKSGFKIKYYKNTNIYYRGSYELDFLDKYLSLFPDIINAPSIKYKLNKNNKIYFPDFYIPSLNLIIEIKSMFWLKHHENLIEAKEKATIANGFNYLMILDKKYPDRLD